MKSKIEQVANLDDEIQDIRKRMRHIVETGDLKLLLRLKIRLCSIAYRVWTFERERSARLAPELRRSYCFEAWVPETGAKAVCKRSVTL